MLRSTLNAGDLLSSGSRGIESDIVIVAGCGDSFKLALAVTVSFAFWSAGLFSSMFFLPVHAARRIKTDAKIPHFFIFLLFIDY